MKNDWFTLWRADRESMIETMVRNMQADIACGYNPNGACITRQREEIARTQAEYEADLDRLGDMELKRVQHWCYMRLVKLGAI